MKNRNILFLVLGMFFASLFFLSLNLGNESLHPWDEAWYAAISKEMFRSGDLLDMKFNGESFWDHPPLGFYLQAFSYWLGGVSEFSTRFPTAITGALTLVVLYLTGRKIKSRWVGVAAALILLSSRWWLIRARTGNLDTLLTLVQAIVFYLIFKLETKKDLWRLWFFYGVSFLAKSSISVTLSPLVLVASFMFLKEKEKFKKVLPTILKALFWFALPLLPWYGYNAFKYGWKFIDRNIFYIGMRKSSNKEFEIEAAKRVLLYLRSAIHRWYRPTQLSLILGALVAIKKPYVRWILAYFVLTIFPYFFSPQTEIWHLIPVIVPLALLIPSVAVEVGEWLLSKVTKMKKKKIGEAVGVLVLTVITAITGLSIKEYWADMIELPEQVSNEARISMEASKSPYPLILQDESYLPTAIFYADKTAKIVDNYHPEIIEDHQRPFQLLTRRYMLRDSMEFKEVMSIEDMVLVEFN